MSLNRKMSMALPGFAALAMAMAVVVSGEMNVQEPIWRDACKGPVCGVAEKQAEGLARLRVLSDYIKQTMSLMESVVSSLDEEMMEVAQELSSVVGRRCHSRGPSALTSLFTHMNQATEDEAENSIIDVTGNSDDTWASSSMTQESTSTLSGDAEAVFGTPSGASQSTSRGHGGFSHHTYHSPSQQPSSPSYSTPHSPSQRPDRISQSSSRISQSSSIVSHSTGKTVSHQPESSQKYEAQQPSASSTSVYVAPEPPRNVGGRGRGQGMGRERGRGRGEGLVLGHGGAGPQGSICKGVPFGSPTYVPGLDSWCAANCPLGNCPSTHCVC